MQNAIDAAYQSAQIVSAGHPALQLQGGGGLNGCPDVRADTLQLRPSHATSDTDAPACQA